MHSSQDSPGLVRLYSSKKEREAFENFAGDEPDIARDVCVFKTFYITRSNLHFADLYAILKTTEKLERAYVRDAIHAKEYEPACQKLIGQFKTLWESLRDEVSGLLCVKSQAMRWPLRPASSCQPTLCMLSPNCSSLIAEPGCLSSSLAGLQVPNIEHFLATYNMQCPMAAKRLIQSGMPATMEHAQPRQADMCLTRQPSDAAGSIGTAAWAAAGLRSCS